VAVIFHAGCSSNPGRAGLVPPRSAWGPGHQDHADQKGDQPGGFEQETGGHSDAVAEDDDAGDDPGHRLRGDARQGVCSGATLKALPFKTRRMVSVASRSLSAVWRHSSGRRAAPIQLAV